MTGDPPQFGHGVRTAFVTGGAGFVGSHVVGALVDAGVAVRALVRQRSAWRGPVAPQIELVEGDLTAPHGWTARLVGCDTLFHLAALYSANPADAARLYAVNVGGTQAVLGAAATAGVQRVVHTSTIGTVGRPANNALPVETTPFNLWSTASPYVRSKWLGEAAALWWNERGLPVVVVNPTAPVGPGDFKPTATGQRIVDFLAGRRPDFPPGGLNLCPVADIAAGHVLAAQRGRPGQRYILGHRGGNLDEATFLALLAEITGLAAPAADQRRGGHRPAALTADPSRAIDELGMPQSDLRAALAGAVAYYRTAWPAERYLLRSAVPGT